MSYTFKSGEYKDRSVEWVALNDYCHLEKILSHKDQGSDNEMVRSVEDIVKKLNNFVPKVKCKVSGCNDIADYLTVAITYGQIPRGDHERFGPTGLSAGKEYTYCEKHKDTHTGYSKAIAYPIKLETLEEIPKWPKWVRKDVQKVIYDCAGFSGKKTEKRCAEFINNLPQKQKNYIQTLSELFAEESKNPNPEINERISIVLDGMSKEELMKAYDLFGPKKLGGYATVAEDYILDGKKPLKHIKEGIDKIMFNLNLKIEENKRIDDLKNQKPDNN